MIYLKYLKPNAKIYKYETANYFGTGEGELNLKRLRQKFHHQMGHCRNS